MNESYHILFFGMIPSPTYLFQAVFSNVLCRYIPTMLHRKQLYDGLILLCNSSLIKFRKIITIIYYIFSITPMAVCVDHN